MKRWIALLLVVLIYAGLTACQSTAPARAKDLDTSGDQTPEKSLEHFRQSLRNNRWEYVHVLLSKRAKNCYSQDKLKTFLTRTIPGALERLRLLQWDVTEFRPGKNKQTAVMTLTHPRLPNYKETYRFRREDGYWRLDWSMADILNVPRSVENCN